MSIIEELSIKPTQYVHAVTYNSEDARLEITFNKGPDTWDASHKTIFNEVHNFERDILDEEDQVGIDNFTDLILEFTEYMGSYYLHLTCTSFSFTTKAKPICKFV